MGAKQGKWQTEGKIWQWYSTTEFGNFLQKLEKLIKSTLGKKFHTFPTFCQKIDIIEKSVNSPCLHPVFGPPFTS
jgi:hypothetical protein